MADRILTWYIDEVMGDGTRQGATYYADLDYDLPASLRMYAGSIPDAGDLQIDIKVGGTSIFSFLPTIKQGESDLDWWEDFDSSQERIEKYSTIQLDITQPGGAKKITVQLELVRSLEQDEEDEEGVNYGR